MISVWLSADFLLNHLWQSTLFAAVAALLTLLFRKNHARVRYALWLAASIKFLIPFSLFIAMGSSIDFGRQQAASITSPAVNIVENISRPFNSEDPLRAIPKAAKPDWAHFIRMPAIAMWLVGCLAVLALYLAKSRSIRAAARNARPLTEGCAFEALQRLQKNSGRRLRVRLACSSSSMEPGVFGIFHPVLLLPAGMPERLDDAQMEAIVAHELAHAGRRDNMVAAIHMFIEALFWFHPMVWWIGAKLVQERERACDEEVLRLGKDPQAYAEGILKVCEFYLESPLACIAGVTGSDMKKRIREIMTRGIGSRLSLAKKALLAVFAISVLATPLIIGLLDAPTSRAQSDAEPKPSFEVASVKPANDVRGISIQMHPGGRLAVNGAPLAFLIPEAYGIQAYQLSGGPAWIYSIGYDIEAKSNAPVSPVRMRLMLQSLLEERFKLKAHREIKDMPRYDLVISKNGQKLKITKNEEGNSIIGESLPTPPLPSGPDGKPMVQSAGTFWLFGNQLQGKSIQLDQLAKTLSQIIGRTVVNKTDLAGAYDINLKWTPDNARPNLLNATSSSPSDNTPSANLYEPSIFTAIQEQLGLKLEPSKGQGEIFTIESAEKPPEN
jgi:bla regulator protein blaR1